MEIYVSNQDRLSSWKCHFSMDGVSIILKDILTSPFYFLSFYKAPSFTIFMIENLFNFFCEVGVKRLEKLIVFIGIKCIYLKRMEV